MVQMPSVVVRILSVWFFVTGLAVLAEDTSDGDVHVLKDENFDQRVQGGRNAAWFVEFYAPWCGHCQKLTPIWEELAEQLASKVQVAKVDATTETRVAKEFEISGFPTLKLIADGKVYKYEGDRTADAMAPWALGDYVGSSSEKLPSEKTLMDKITTEATKFMESSVKVFEAVPVVPLVVLFVGVTFGFLLVVSCNVCRRPKIPKHVAHSFDVDAARGDNGSVGLDIDPLTMKISKKDGRAEFKSVETGDRIIAVNKNYIQDADDYRAFASGLKKFTLTIGRSEKGKKAE